MAAIVGSLFLNIPKAKATSLSDNLDYTRQVVAEVTPNIVYTPVDTEAAILTLAPDGYLNKPLVVETQITPVRSQPVRTTLPKTAGVKTVVSKVKLDNSGGNHFVWGYCTWYVAERRNIPWFGNAGTWLTGARNAGFATGDTPQVGAIMVTSEGSVGHAAIVDAVNADGTITVSEMNYRGFGVISSRTISTSYGAIKGYIY